VNGLVSYGLLDETADDNTRHTLCIGGNTRQGPGKWYIPDGGMWDADTKDCFTELIAKEKKEDEERAALSS